MSGTLADVADWVFSIVDRLGAVGVGLLILLENILPPIPSEVILPLAGFRARTGALNVVAVWPAATAGSVLGALLLYGLGAWLGYDRLHRLAGHRWFVFVSQKDLERGEAVFERHGGKVVLLARCVPFLRSVVSIPAGISGMPLMRFVVLTAIGSGVWNAAFIALGWVLGENWEQVETWLGPVSYVVLALLAVGLVALIVRRLRGSAVVPPR
jgi:membrane protein DedA with SNARE-associated domain